MVYFHHRMQLRFRGTMPASDLLKRVPYMQVSESVGSHVVTSLAFQGLSFCFGLGIKLRKCPCLHWPFVE